MTKTAWSSLFHSTGASVPSVFSILAPNDAVVMTPLACKGQSLLIPSAMESPFGADPYVEKQRVVAEILKNVDIYKDRVRDLADIESVSPAMYPRSYFALTSTDAIPLTQLWKNLTRARDAVRDLRWEDAATNYKLVRDELGRPSDGTESPSARFFRLLHNGDLTFNELQTEAVLEFAQFADPGSLDEVLNDLHALIPRLERRLNAIKARLDTLHAGRLPDHVTGSIARFARKDRDERLDRVKNLLSENELKRLPLEQTKIELLKERAAIDGKLGPLGIKLKNRGNRLDALNEEIASLNARLKALPFFGKAARAERKELLVKREDCEERVLRLYGQYDVLVGECEELDGARETNNAQLRDAGEGLDVLFAERLAIHAEADALDAAFGGDTDWLQVIDARKVEKEAQLFKARMLQGLAIMRYAADAGAWHRQVAGAGTEQGYVPRVQHYEMAERVAKSLVQDLVTLSSNRHQRIRLYAQLMFIESVARQAECACRRDDQRALELLLDKLMLVVRGVTSEYDTPDVYTDGDDEGDQAKLERDLIAAQVADVAMMLVKMGLRQHAVEHAHELTKLKAYRSAPAVRAMLASPEFAAYRNENETGIISPEAVKERIPWHVRSIQRLRAAFPNARYRRRFLEPLAAGLTSTGVTMGLQFALTGEVTAVPAALVAVGATTALRLLNGWHSPAALSAGITGTFERTARESAWDAGSVLLRGGMGFVGWMIPAGLVSTGIEHHEALARAAVNIRDAWLTTIPDKIGGALPPLTHENIAFTTQALDAGRVMMQPGPGLTLPALRQVISRDEEARALWPKEVRAARDFMARRGAWLMLPAAGLLGATMTSAHLKALYYLYMASAGGLYAAYTFRPHMRTELQRIAKAFVPGAILLGAHLGMNIKGDAEWSAKHWERILLSSVSTLEGVAMLFMSGSIPLPRMQSIKEYFTPPFGRKAMGEDAPPPFWRSLGRGVWYDANHMAMVAISVTVGVSSAVGGLILKDHPPSLPLIAMLGAMTSGGLLPMTLLVSGIMKQQIPVIPLIQESLQDTEDKGVFRRTWEATASAAYAFRAPYLWNRVLRVPTLDVPAAFVRALIGWDSIWGYLPFFGINTIFGNPTATMMRPETAGTPWQHDALSHILANHRIDQDKLIDHWRKSAQYMSAWHFMLFYGHRPHEIKDWAYPFLGIQRIWNPPDFPLRRQKHYLADFYLYVTGQTPLPHRITPSNLRRLLGEIECVAMDPAQFETVRPLVQVLYKAQAPGNGESAGARSVSGQRVVMLRDIIREWFVGHPWVTQYMHLNTEELHPMSLRATTRRVQRMRVRAAVEGSMRNYLRTIDAHHGRRRQLITETLKLFR